jgi:REP element-mobilizing transposase RayT
MRRNKNAETAEMPPQRNNKNKKCSGRACSTSKNSKIRKNIRLRDYDYTSNGAYFVTICTHFKRKCIGEKERSIIEQELLSLQERFPGVGVDVFVIMPNHVHTIISLNDSAVSLSRIIQVFKSVTTLKLKKSGYNGRFLWQRNFYEHVIRNEKALAQIRKYAVDNPAVERIDVEKFYDK